MRAEVRLRTPSGQVVRLGPGDLIGRTSAAALVIDDPRVSEAHALVSLRRGDLFLLALRRLFGVRGKPTAELRLVRGLELDIVEGLRLHVEEVITPAEVIALRGPGIAPRPLGQVVSFLAGSPPQTCDRFVPGAIAHLWSLSPERWRIRIGADDPFDLELGQRFVIDGVELEVCVAKLAAAEHLPTDRGGGFEPGLRIVAHYESVELHRDNTPPVMIGGIGARLISELVSYDGPVGWEVLARELWRDDVDAMELRHRWDVALSRVRTRLREGGIRPDLLRSDGGGQIQLVLYEGDRVLDRT